MVEFGISLYSSYKESQLISLFYRVGEVWNIFISSDSAANKVILSRKLRLSSLAAQGATQFHLELAPDFTRSFVRVGLVTVNQLVLVDAVVPLGLFEGHVSWAARHL